MPLKGRLIDGTDTTTKSQRPGLLRTSTGVGLLLRLGIPKQLTRPLCCRTDASSHYGRVNVVELRSCNAFAERPFDRRITDINGSVQKSTLLDKSFMRGATTALRECER